jgi:hypothetical protein
MEKREPTQWERFVDATRRVVSVPKSEIDKTIRNTKRRKARRKRSSSG